MKLTIVAVLFKFRSQRQLTATAKAEGPMHLFVAVGVKTVISRCFIANFEV
jgi:hypothetical protein